MRSGAAFALTFTVQCAGCGGCAPTSGQDASMDAAPRDASDARVRDADAAQTTLDVATAPWADGGAYVFGNTRVEFSPASMPTCNGQPAVAIVGPMYNSLMHWKDDSIYYSLSGNAGRVRVGQNFVEVFNVNPVTRATFATTDRRVLLGITHSDSLSDRVFELELRDGAAAGTALWQTERIDRRGGISNLQATSSFVAFTWEDFGDPLNATTRLWVMNPDGSNARQLSSMHTTREMRASGDRLVVDLAGHVYVWRVGDAAPRRISPTPAPQWHPWIDRERVAWIDQRHGGGDRVDPDNPEVYYSDLNTGEVRRITSDPPSRPAVQDAVTIEGEWIAWMDLRNATRPNGGFLANRMDIYGYHIPTGTEVALVNDPNCQASQPALIGGRLFFTGYVEATGTSHMYEAPLPVMRDR